MRDYLQSKTLAWLDETMQTKISPENMEAASQWFREVLVKR